MSAEKISNDAQRKLTDGIESMMAVIDRDYLRGIQRRFFECGLRCTNDSSLDHKRAQDCVQRCQIPLQNAEGVVQHEIDAFQNRIQRCFMDCQDTARDNVAKNPSSASSQNSETHVYKCIAKCCDSHGELLPSFMDRVKSGLSNIQQT